jgi:hypothetical protein
MAAEFDADSISFYLVKFYWIVAVSVHTATIKTLDDCESYYILG